jgi:uncharacterized protein
MDLSGISEDAIFKIGRVISVDGRIIRVRVDTTKNTSHLLYRGKLLKNISVGGYIKIAKGFTSIVGKVDGEFVVEDKQFGKSTYKSDKDKVSRTLSVSLLGFFDGDTFIRGIKEMPLIDNECFLLRANEFSQVHNFINQDDEPIVLGTLSLERGHEIAVGVNSLFASHIGIFGNTGSGKSYTLARLYNKLFARYKTSKNFRKRAQFLFIDFNGEYSTDANDSIIVEEPFKQVYRLSTRVANGSRLPVSSSTIHNAEFWTVFLEATEKTQKPFLRRSVENTFLQSKIESEDELRTFLATMTFDATHSNDKNVESDIVVKLLMEVAKCFGGNNSLNELALDYREHLHFNSHQHDWYYGEGNNRIYANLNQFAIDVIDAKFANLALPTNALLDIDQVRMKIILNYYSDIIRGHSNKEHLSPLLKRMDKRIDDLKKVICVDDAVLSEDPPRNLTIVSLKDVNVHIRKIIPLLLCKQMYEKKKELNDPSCYLNLIIDEAHNILSESSERESEQWKDYRLEVFEEIIKEGRKFGVFVTLASQRPSDISPTIISQLHNYFLHRLINNQDIKAIERTVSFLDKLSFESLPILPTGTCIFAGLLANIPVVVDIGKIEKLYEPRNKTMTLVDQWQDDAEPSPPLQTAVAAAPAAMPFDSKFPDDW